MSVRKRKWITRLGEAKEAWIVDYTDQQGERHIETFERKKDADARHSTIRVNVRQGTHVVPSSSVTVAVAAENWLKRAEAEGLERATIQTYRQHVNLHISPRLGKVKLANLTPPKVEAFRDDLLANLSRPTARKVWISFKSLLKVAKCAHVADGVTIKAKERAAHKLEQGRDFPTPGEIKRLIEAAKGNLKWRTLLLTAALTGLRASELRGLRWADVDYLNANELHVRQRADRFNTIGRPKTPSSVRKLPLAPEALSALKEWRLACPKGELDLVFPTASGRPMLHSNLRRSLRPIMVAAGIVGKGGEPKYGIHALRHFFASWCINSVDSGGRGLLPKEAQQLLGHASIVITLDRYGHLFPHGDDPSKLAAASRALLA
jgi:integrase